MKPIDNAIAQYHFERKPPYQEEAIMRTMGKEVDVEYNLRKVEQKTKTVTEKDNVSKMYTATNKEAKMDNSGPLPMEAVLEKVFLLKEKFPNLETLSDKEKINIIADIVSGKYDELIFNGVEVKSS